MIYHDIRQKTVYTMMGLLVFSVNAKAQFTGGSSFHVNSGTQIAIDSLTLQPSVGGLDLSNTTLGVSYTPIPPVGSGNGSIARVYQFTPALAFDGTLGLYYLNGELNGNNATLLSLAYANGGAFSTDSLTAVGNINNYVVASTGTNTIHVNRITSIESGAPLPIDLLSFTAKAVQKKTLIEWSTAQEINCDRFEIERSTDGISFLLLSSERAVGNSSTRNDYKTYDEKPSNGWNYYRLKEIDVNGSYKRSQVVPVYFGNGNGTYVSAYPNPVQNKLSIAINSEKEQIFPVLLTDALGRIIQSHSLQLVTGNNSFSLDMNGLAAGSYMLKIGNSFQTKIVKEQ